MEYLRKLNKDVLFILLIIVLASILRFIWIDKVPNAVGGDELTYIVNAKAMVISGSDISGTWNPLSIFLFNYPPNQIQAELPYFLIAPLLKFVSLSLLSVRFVYVFMSIFTVLLIYLITKELINKNVALWAAFIAAINPWFIYIGRTNYEVVPATLFFLCGLYFLLINKRWRFIFSSIFFILAFYSYIGTKIIFFPFVLISVLYSYFYIAKKKYLKNYLAILFLSLFLVLFFAISLKISGNSRVSEIISINDPAISGQVNFLRANSLQNPFTNLLESKLSVFTSLLENKFISTVSFDYLFARGDEFFSNLNHGLFYFFDFIFFILGIGFTFKKQTRIGLLLLLMIVISIMPHLLHGVKLDNFTPHIALLFPFFIIFIAVGIRETVSFFQFKSYLLLSTIIVVVIYLVSLAGFLNIYFYQFPLRGYFDFPLRLVSKYASLNSSEKVTVYSSRSYDLFTKYLFYADKINKNNQSQIRNSIKNKRYILDNIEFVSCDNTLDFSKVMRVGIYDFNCGPLPKEYKHLTIPRLLDGGQSYQIYNDKICKNFDLKRYPQNIQIDDFSIESQSAQKFCETFITSW